MSIFRMACGRRLRGRGVFAAGLVLAGLLPGQGRKAVAVPLPTPAHWTVTGMPKRPFAAGSTFVLTLSAAIQPGWHIYALEEPDGGPLATQIGLAEGDALTLLAVDEPKPRMVPDPVLHQVVGMFENDAGFSVRVRSPRTPLAPDAMGHVLVRYQSCNDQVCLPPHTETVLFPLHSFVR